MHDFPFIAAACHCLARALPAAPCAALLIAAALPLVAGAAPYAGTPIALPGVFEAENFDSGGEGVGYHDKVAGNAGRRYRRTEDVDIIRSADGGDGYAISHFETGEWLAYTINVAASARYTIELRVASAFSTSAFHIEIDGVDVIGRVTVPNTSNWNTFHWVGRKGISLTAGQHVLKIVADQEYFNLDSVRVTATAVPTWQSYVVFDFHQGGPAGQANFHVNFEDGHLIFRGNDGAADGLPYKAMIGPIAKNVWYDFVYHVKWSSGMDGFFRAWVNGTKRLDHRGPTMRAGDGINLKLANYHMPVCDPYPGCTGAASSVIHDRVIRGTTPLAVSIGPLEGVLEPVNGVLTLLH